jgi:hypothetical protein
MIRRTITAAIGGMLALVALAPAAMAAPSLQQSGYDAGGGDAEWPEVQAFWLGGPKVDGVPDGTAEPSVASAALAITADTCDVVLPDPTIDIEKTADRTQLSPGQMRLRVQLDTAQPAGDFRLRDCIWIDDGDGVWEEPTETLFGVDLEPTVWVPDTTDNVGSFLRFRVNLPVAANQDVCDRAARSELEGEPVTTFLRSNTLCLPGAPDPVVSEAALAVLLPLTAAVLGGGVWFLRRRRSVAA